MAKHGDIMGAFKKASEGFNYDDPEHKTLVRATERRKRKIDY
jgi:hypothetical protein